MDFVLKEDEAMETKCEGWADEEEKRRVYL